MKKYEIVGTRWVAENFGFFVLASSHKEAITLGKQEVVSNDPQSADGYFGSSIDTTLVPRIREIHGYLIKEES